MLLASLDAIFAAPKWRGSAPFFPMGGSLTLHRVPLCWIRYLGLVPTGSAASIAAKASIDQVDCIEIPQIPWDRLVRVVNQCREEAKDK